MRARAPSPLPSCCLHGCIPGGLSLPDPLTTARVQVLDWMGWEQGAAETAGELAGAMGTGALLASCCSPFYLLSLPLGVQTFMRVFGMRDAAPAALPRPHRTTPPPRARKAY